MRVLVVLLISLGLLAACEEHPATTDAQRLGLRAPDDPLLRTTAGGGTSGHDDRGPSLPDGTTGTTSDPTGGSTGAPQESQPAERGGTTGTSGGLRPSAPRAGSPSLPA